MLSYENIEALAKKLIFLSSLLSKLSIWQNLGKYVDRYLKRFKMDLF